ncbi:MAG: RraA family protein [Desulfobulbaceae bacterium]|nr:MAG: RraA family protein [Desulfobulbaceae bacterium]
MVSQSLPPHLPSTSFAELLGIEQIMDNRIQPLWIPEETVHGAAYTVQCGPGDNLMLHTATHQAPAGSVIVVQAGDEKFAMAGGNVCAVAQKRGIRGFVIDGVIRDIREIREAGFPVFCTGLSPKPGTKEGPGNLQTVIQCGSVFVNPNDIVIADEEGIVIVPASQYDDLLQKAQKKAAFEASQTLEQWQSAHRQKIQQCLQESGYTDPRFELT